MRPIKELFREVIEERDNSDVERALGMTRAQSEHLLDRSMRIMWVGFKLGAYTTTAAFLVILGGWALVRFFAR